MNDILDTPFRKSFRTIQADERKFAERQERLFEEQNQVGFFDAARAAFEKENSLYWFLEGLDEDKYKVDPEFDLDDETFDELTKDMPVETWDFLEEAVNLDHAKALREKTLKSIDNEKTLQSYGWSGVGLRMASALIDPLAIGATVVTGGAIGPAIWGSKATRLGNAFRGAVGGAATNAAIESYLVSQDAVKDPYDIIYGTAAGFLLGGAFGGLAKIPDAEFDGAVGKFKKDFENAQIADLSEKMKRDIGYISDAPIQNQIADEIQIPNMASNNITDYADLDDAPMSEYSNIRFDMVGRGKGSKLNSVRSLFSTLGEDAVGFNRNNATMSPTADIKKTIIFNTERGKVAETYNSAYKDWSKGNKIGIVQRTFSDKRSEYGKQVSDQIENPKADAPEAVKKSAERISESFRELLRRAKAAGVEGFESIPENLRYFTHLWQPFKFKEMSVAYSEDNVIALLKKSFLNADPELTDDLAEEIAKGMYRKIDKAEFGRDTGLARIFTTDEKDILKSILVEEEILSQEGAERLINLFGRKPIGEPARAKRRLKIDVDAELALEDGTILRIKDLMDRDAERVFDSYAQQMAGRIGLAEVGIKSESQFRKIISEINAEGKAKGLTKEASAQIQSAEILFDLILGRNPASAPFNAKPGSTTAKAARLVSDYNFLRLMNQVGFAQVAELGNILTLGGVRGLVQVVPEFGSLIRRAKNGELEDQVAKDIVSFMGVGNERAINAAFNRFDPVENYVASSTTKLDKILDKSISFAQPMKRMTADISGMAPITLMLERAAARVAMQTITDSAFKTAKISAKRLSGLGLDEQMSERVYSQIRKHAVVGKSPVFKNQKLRATNMDEWDDLEARSAFTVAVVRMTRRSIQQNDLGNLNKYMTGTMGKLITQFRTFMLVSYAKQTLHGLKAFDLHAAMGFMATTMFASASYVAQTHFNAIGRDDRSEFLEERLNPLEIAKSSFQRSSYASLIPAAVDTGAMFLTTEPVFAYGRTTGLASNAISGIPTVDLANKAFKASTGLTRQLFNPDLQWSQSHQRAANSLLPLQNALGIKNVLNLLVEAAPETQRVE
tara:strand:+ start:3418 stop:6633 length:3216 start_codon:yes stop_codon:yes gene_type:complete